jgi:predicted HD phosphohydrolase
MEDFWREMLIKGASCWQLKDFRRKPLAKAGVALRVDNEKSKRTAKKTKVRENECSYSSFRVFRG